MILETMDGLPLYISTQAVSQEVNHILAVSDALVCHHAVAFSSMEISHLAISFSGRFVDKLNPTIETCKLEGQLSSEKSAALGNPPNLMFSRLSLTSPVFGTPKGHALIPDFQVMRISFIVPSGVGSN